MEMLLMGLCMALLGTAVAAAAFGAATRSESPGPSIPSIQPELPSVKAVPAARFFADSVARPAATPSPQASIEVLLQQIENHVRLEQAAAETFLAFPTQTQLHRKTNSPFVN